MADDLLVTAKKARLRLLQMHFESGVGHIGGNLSALDLLICLFSRVLQKNDRFVLSKGHSAGALYIALWSIGRLNDADLRSFHRDGTLLAGHPCPRWHADILFGTGSLGHGLSLASGIAWAKQKSKGHVFCLLSDGDLNAGSTWEALHFVAHHQLPNITLIVDMNGLQGFGATSEVLRMGSLGNRLRDLNFDVHECDGHNFDDILGCLEHGAARPRALLARTIKGKGVSFMENRMEWHYLPLDEKLYRQAIAEIERCY